MLVVAKYNEMKKSNPDVSFTKVATKLNFLGHKHINRNFVKRTVKRMHGTGGLCDKSRNVRKRKISESVKSSVIKHVKNTKKPKYTRSVRATSKLAHGRGTKRVRICRESVRTILKDSGQNYRLPKRRPKLTKHHIRMRFMWADKHKDDSVEDWERTLSVDETHYETFHKSNRRNCGSWVDEDDEIEYEMTVKHPGRVSASTGVCGRGAATVDLYTDTFNSKKFKKIHLTDHYIPAMEKFQCSRLMMDNDKSHHAKICLKLLREKDVEFSAAPPPPCHRQRCRCEPPSCFWFPAYAPEVSPAELYNNYVQQKLDEMTQRLGHPKSQAILKSRVRRIVKETPSSYFKNLMGSMPKRVKKLFEARGKYFK